ncbi:MAG TPA: hypothetical protein VFF07_03700 [Actinomycetota bacterium]|nr:hypothetical protein [Actinomycetota bacterium]
MWTTLRCGSRALEARRVSDGPTTVGTEFVQVTHFLGRRFESQFEVTEFEANHRFSFKSTSGPFPIETFETFEPTGSATRVTQILRGGPGGFFNVARAVLLRLGQQQLDRPLET